jgi:hypothetical protein
MQGVELMRAGARHREERLLGLRAGDALVEPEAPGRTRHEQREHAQHEGDEFRANGPAHGAGRRPSRMSIDDSGV